MQSGDHLPHQGPAIRVVDAHLLDALIAWLSSRSKIFSQGWGDEELLAGLSGCVSPADPLANIEIAWDEPVLRDGFTVRDGSFASPLQSLPPASQTVHLRAWTATGNQAACVIPAASRDEGYQVRERVFKPLLPRGIDLYFLENPYYGKRRTAGGPAAITVSDHGQMALGMVLEARALLACLRGRYARLAVAGYSMGGHMAAITAAVSPFPVACAALATGASASSIYTRGMLSWSVDVEALAGTRAEADAARQRLRQFFDAADVTHYPPPQRPDAAIIAGCTRDGYVLKSETERLHQYWPGSTLRWIPAGHFSALVTQRRTLCDCVADAVARL